MFFGFLKKGVRAGDRFFGETVMPDIFRSVPTSGVCILAVVGRPETAVMAQSAVTVGHNDDFVPLSSRG
jgi:hypothetical protein